MNIKFKFNIGDKCSIQSRYDGLQTVTIISQINNNKTPYYELDKLIQISKNGDRVGSAECIEHEEEYIFPECCDKPCPEYLLTKIN